MRKMTWESLVLGSMLMLLGGNIAIHGDFYSSKYERVIEFKGNHSSIGILMALVGFGFVITSFKKKKVDPEESCNYICPKCEGVLTARSMLPPTCPKCKVKVEVLTGFYDMHPELVPPQKETIKEGQAEFTTCNNCGKTFYRQDCPGNFCPDCQTTL